MLPRILNVDDSTLKFYERIATMDLARQETNHLRASETIRKALDYIHRFIVTPFRFSTNDQVWFHRKRHGWRKGLVTAIYSPQIIVTFGNIQYPTHESRVRPFHGDSYRPPDLLIDDAEEYHVPEQITTESAVSRVPVSNLLNSVFSVSSVHTPLTHSLFVEDLTIS